MPECDASNKWQRGLYTSAIPAERRQCAKDHRHPHYPASRETDGKALKDIIGNARMSAAARGEMRHLKWRMSFLFGAITVKT